ncbi:FAD binding domain-containing protein [Chelatococcus reniformis]|uniref:Carbon monoxide dehydrogenase n=1 Tax=Chelatococcus reniformis TaxID=1494448 RepID=A0A916XMF5_9HYPH|nr:FAD binding domain-containing protein [Chelatococcus reniformis]GGC86835.1 carbon monoxide dehydrogenase [Chelatococcus reniformis]
MKPPSFAYARPGTVAEAAGLLAQGDGAVLLAGGQSLMPMLNLRLAAPDTVIDINGIAGLADVRRDDGRLRIGAMARQAALMRTPAVGEALPLLALALPHIGHPQTRSRGTIGGSLCHADPAAELALVAVAADAVLTLLSSAGTRTVPARAFFLHAMETVRAADEILTEITFPASRPGARCAFRELARRHGDFAIAAVAAEWSPEGLTIAVGGLEATPRVCAHLSRELAGRPFEQAAVVRLIDEELAQTEPLEDGVIGPDYRLQLARVLLNDCLAEVLPP